MVPDRGGMDVFITTGKAGQLEPSLYGVRGKKLEDQVCRLSNLIPTEALMYFLQPDSTS